MNGNSQKRPPPPPRRQVPPPDVTEAKKKEDAKPCSELQNLLSTLRKEQEERRRVQNGTGSGCRPRPPPPPPNAGRGRGNGTKPTEGTPQPLGKQEAPRPLRVPFAADTNQNVFQDADEAMLGKQKTVKQELMKTSKIDAEEKVKKEVVKPSVDTNQNIIQDAEEKVEKSKTCLNKPQRPKYYDTEIDAAVRELILADQRPLQLEPLKFNLEDYVKKMPHADDKKYIAATLALEIKV